MSISRSGLALLAVWLIATGAQPQREAQAQAQTATAQAQATRQAPAAINLPAQTLKLIPMPREVSAGAVQSLAGGVQINCAAPCAAEDSFAIDDLKAYLASLGVAVNTTSAVNILVARYGPPLAKSIYSDAASNDPAAKAGGRRHGGRDARRDEAGRLRDPPRRQGTGADGGQRCGRFLCAADGEAAGHRHRR